MIISLFIAVLTIALFILSVLFFPSVGKNKKLKIYSLIPMVGAIAMIAFTALSLRQVVDCFTENTSVNPIKILILFLSMTVYSLILDKTGFFVYISNAVLKRTGHNQHALFLSLYCVISFLTVFKQLTDDRATRAQVSHFLVYHNCTTSI